MASILSKAVDLCATDSGLRLTKGTTTRLLEAVTSDDDHGLGEKALEAILTLTAKSSQATLTLTFLTSTLHDYSHWRSQYKALHLIEYLVDHSPDPMHREVLSLTPDVAILCDSQQTEGDN